MASSSLAWFLLLIDSLLLPVNPVGPPVPAAQLCHYVPNSAQVVFHIDIRSMKLHFERSITELGKRPFVAKDPMIKSMFDRLDRMIKGAMNKAERELKVVKLNQIRFITVALSFERRMSKPEIMVIVHGEFQRKMLEGFIADKKIKVLRESSKGFTFFHNQNKRKPSFAWTPTGQILLATSKTLQALAKTGPEEAAPGSLKANFIRGYRPNHTIAIGLKMTPIFRRQFRRAPGMFQALLMDMDQVYTAVWGGGSLANVTATSPQTLNRYRLILEGVGQIGVAGDFLRRGILNVADGLFEPSGQKIRNPILASLAKHKDALFSYIRHLYTNTSLRYKVTTHGKSAQLQFIGNGGALIPVGGVLAGIGIFARNSRSARPKRISPRTAYPRTAYPTRSYPKRSRHRRHRYRRSAPAKPTSAPSQAVPHNP